MSHISSKPPRPVRHYSTQSDCWSEAALQDLLDREIIVIDGVVIDGRNFDPRAPAQRQMLARLRAAGVKLSRVATGMTGPAP
jgi:hypothetical protein